VWDMLRAAFSERRPYQFVLLVELMVIGVYLVSGTAAHLLHFGGLGVYVVANAALTVLLAVVLTRMRWWHRVGFRRADGRTLLWVLPMCLPVLVNIYPGLAPGGVSRVAGFLALALMVGFVEESAFRGLMLRVLQPRGVWRAVVITTALFSLTHLMNIMAGETGLQAALQLLYAGAIGFAFAALALRSGVLWPLVAVHALIDFVAFLQDPAVTVPRTAEVVLDLVVTVVFVAYGLVVMLARRSAPDTARGGAGLPSTPPQVPGAQAGHLVAD